MTTKMMEKPQATIMHKTKNDIPEQKRKELVQILNLALAHLLNLRLDVKQAHWNVKGMRFIALHELFDMLAEELDPLIDKTAERATALGGVAQGTVETIQKNSALKAYPLDAVSGEDHLYELISRYALVGKTIRELISVAADEKEDQDTADLFTEISRALDLRLWFLEAHIQA